MYILEIKEESATEKEAVGYVNKLFSEILDQEYDKKSLDSGKVVVSAEINNQEDSRIKVHILMTLFFFNIHIQFCIKQKKILYKLQRKQFF